MTNAAEHANRLESMISVLLTHAAGKPPADEKSSDEEEIGRLGEELLGQPGAADVIGDMFDRIVGMDPANRERRAAILDASWAGVGARVED